MTSKTSFFNKGIYKSTVKRYSWGAILYFVILFVSTGLAAFLNTDREYQYLPVDHFQEYPLILSGASITVPMLLALFVPTVAALLIFRFIHSKKQSIFIHSLPVCRMANYISSIAAAFTLMFVPVILNGIILIFMSLGGFGDYFTVQNCLQWIGYNLYGVFLMFSVAVLACCLTGNSFAAVALNALIHGFLFLTIASVEVIADTFVYGYVEGHTLFERLAENNFFVIVFSFSDRYFRRNMTILQLANMGLYAVLMYVASYFLYKKRRLETATDVAGYKILNPIFKYLVTFLATTFAFAVLTSYIDDNPAVFVAIVAIIGLIAYAAAEMVLKKTINVLYSWKGYVAYAAVFAAFISVFAFTSFFGYENRLPDRANISEVAVFNYYYQEDEPFSSEAAIIDLALEEHEKLVNKEDIPVLNNVYTQYTTRIHFKYKLKDGREVYRMYPIESDKAVEIMDKFYANEEYKKKCERIFINADNITGMFVYSDERDKEIEDYEELLSLIQQDTLDLSYGELHAVELPMREGRDIVDTEILYNNSVALYSVRVEFKRDEADGDEKAYISGFQVDVTDKYERTVKWLEEQGFVAFEH